MAFREISVEFALIDIEMPGMKGVELAKELRKNTRSYHHFCDGAQVCVCCDFYSCQADYFVLNLSKKDVENTCSVQVAV